MVQNRHRRLVRYLATFTLCMEPEPRPVADSEPDPPLVEAEYEVGCFAQATVLSRNAQHTFVRFKRYEPNWHPAGVLALDGQTLSQIASTLGYPPVLLVAANRSLGTVNTRLTASSKLTKGALVKLPAAVLREQGESLVEVAKRYNVEADDLERHNTNSAGSDGADLLHSTWLLLPTYRRPGLAPILPRLSAEAPVPGDARKARCCMPTLPPPCPRASQGPVEADTAVMCQRRHRCQG